MRDADRPGPSRHAIHTGKAALALSAASYGRGHGADERVEGDAMMDRPYRAPRNAELDASRKGLA